MQTSCPECRTAFRVSQGQLGLRRGLVRCGQCNAVFNAYDSLLPELEEPPLAAPEPVPDALTLGTQTPTAAHDWASQAEIRLHESVSGAAHGSTSGSLPEGIRLAPPEADGPDGSAILLEALPPSTVDASLVQSLQQRAEESAESILLSELPNRKPPRPRLPLWQRIGYLLIALPLLALLPLQAAYYFRADLVAAAPAARPGLEMLCQVLGCTVPLPKQLGRDAIAASNLEHDPEQKSRVRLTVLLANRTGQTQTWPVLSLTLTDVRENPVAQKLFPPQVYLPQGTDPRAGMASGSEREIRLDLDIGNLAATGYALVLDYP